MASVYDGALTPVEGSVGDLFGDRMLMVVQKFLLFL